MHTRGSRGQELRLYPLSKIANRLEKVDQIMTKALKVLYLLSEPIPKSTGQQDQFRVVYLGYCLNPTYAGHLARLG